MTDGGFTGTAHADTVFVFVVAFAGLAFAGFADAGLADADVDDAGSDDNGWEVVVLAYTVIKADLDKAKWFTQ